MEFDEALSLLQGTICSLGNLGLLNREDSLPGAVEALKKVTQNLPEDEKSKATFFMILNSNLSISEELKDDDFVGLFTSITPSIEVEYLIQYLYHLKLQQHLFKVIENCPAALTSELLNVTLKKLESPSFHRNKFGWDHIYQLWQSIFVKICKICYGAHAKDDFQEFKSYFSHVCNKIEKMLVVLVRTKGLENVTGRLLYNFFKSFLYCLKQQKNPNLCDEPLFKLSSKFEQKKTQTNGVSIKDCTDMMFHVAVKILENLTVDLWVAFAECYFEFDSRNSVQVLIGNLVHTILEEMEGCNVPSDVLNCLSSLAIDKFTSAGLDEIILNISNGEKEWFGALLKHPKVTEYECVKCLTENINLASSSDLNALLSLSYEFICGAEEDKNLDSMKDLFLAAVKKSPDHLKWMRKVLAGKPGLLSTGHTQDDLTETFNKISKERSLPKHELISLCIQAPLETIRRICQLAISGSLAVEDVVEILKEVQVPCGRLGEEGSACVECVLFKTVLREELSEKEKQLLIDLIVCGGKEELFGGVFARNLMRTLKMHVEKADLEKAVLCLEIMKHSINFEYFSIDKVVVLVYLSQVLGHFTWDLESFWTTKADGRDVIISIVAGIMKEVDAKEIERKCWWARREILKCWEVNQVCFCELWFRFGHSWPCSEKLPSCILALAHTRHKRQDLAQKLVKVGEPLDVKASIVLCLSVVLPVVTYSEWSSIFGALIGLWENGDGHGEVLDMFGSGLYLITVCLRGRRMYPCYEYCLRNFGRLVSRNLAQMSVDSLVQTLEKIFFVLTAIEEEEERKSCWMDSLPVVLELVECVKKKNASESHRSGILEMLTALASTDIVETVKKRLC